MIEEMWHEFFCEHERVMLELTIGKVIPPYRQPIDFTSDLLEFAEEIGATVVVGLERGQMRVKVHDDLWDMAVALCDHSVSKTELVQRLLITFIGLHTDRVKLRRKSGARRSLFAGRMLTGDLLISDVMDDLRVEGWLDPEEFGALLDGELAFDPVAKKRRLKAGLGKKGSRRRRDQIRRRKEREARKLNES
jgi:hypothetical protein